MWLFSLQLDTINVRVSEQTSEYIRIRLEKGTVTKSLCYLLWFVVMWFNRQTWSQRWRFLVDVMYCQAFDTKPSQTGQVARNGYHLHYQIHGTGPIKLCFILGMMQPMAAMKIIVDRIVALGKYSFLLLDNRGFGLSSGGAFGRFTTSELALDALCVLEHVDWTFNVNLSGGSLGGMIAQEMAASRPAYFRSLVLFCTWGQPAFPNFSPPFLPGPRLWSPGLQSRTR